MQDLRPETSEGLVDGDWEKAESRTYETHGAHRGEERCTGVAVRSMSPEAFNDDLCATYSPEPPMIPILPAKASQHCTFQESHERPTCLPLVELAGEGRDNLLADNVYDVLVLGHDGLDERIVNMDTRERARIRTCSAGKKESRKEGIEGTR